MSGVHAGNVLVPNLASVTIKAPDSSLSAFFVNHHFRTALPRAIHTALVQWDDSMSAQSFEEIPKLRGPRDAARWVVDCKDHAA
jgi:hypothetical protein